MNKLWNSALLLLVTLLLTTGCQQKPKPAIQADRAENTPEGFVVAEGFEIELIAREPLVADPVDMTIDEYGRFYIVEMPGYPLDVSGSGRVKLLSDTNGDGQLDTSQLFAEGLTLPTGIMRWKKGVLVVDTPNVLYFEDTDGDGKADKREPVLTGFALSNPQHNVNNPELGLDNWIYLGHEPAITTNLYEEKFGDKGSTVHFVGDPDSPRLPVNAGGRSVRFRPDSRELELLASKTQFGHSFTAWGHRLTVNNNNHIMQEVLAAPYLERNPYLPVASATQSLSDHGEAAQVYPITQNPEHQLLTDEGVITSASGITAYLGGAFSDDYNQASFVAESVSNLVHADRLTEKGASFVASRMQEDHEFLASTDAWFRPVNLYVGPQGGLYVVDYYRRIVEHPEWMAEEDVAAGNLYDGREQGRIYRIRPKGMEQGLWPGKRLLGNASTSELIAALAHKNIWWRGHAQRLLVDAYRAGAMTPEDLAGLEAMAQNRDRPLGRLHALWALEGTGQLRPELIVDALSDSTAGVRENAIRLAEAYIDTAPQLKQSLVSLKNEPHPRVRFQLLLTLGYIHTDEATQRRMELLFSDLDDPWMQVAALSAAPELNSGFLDKALANYDSDKPAYRSLVERLAAMEMAAGSQERILQLVSMATDKNTNKAWQPPLLEGMAGGYAQAQLSSVTLGRIQSLLLTRVLSHSSLAVRESGLVLLDALPDSGRLRQTRLLDQARRQATDNTLAERERLVSLKFLAVANAEQEEPLFKALLSPGEPLTVQLGALEALSRIEGVAVARFLLDDWPELTPKVRGQAVDLLLQTPDRIALLLDALEAGRVQSASLGWRRSVRLMTQADESLRKRARALLAPKDGARQEVVQSYQEALMLNGSAQAGERVYQSQCAVCHKMGDNRGHAFGPDLASLGNRQAGNLLVDILDPNRSIADGYDLWAVSLKEGGSVQGVIAAETSSAITLRQMAGQESVISRQAISSMTLMPISAMPESLESSINKQQMADLLAFIRQRD